MNCPLCGARVLYQGLSSIECAGAPEEAKQVATRDYPGYKTIPAKPACPNYKPSVPRIGDLEIGSLDWARYMWLQGWWMQEYVFDQWIGEYTPGVALVHADGMRVPHEGANPWRIHPDCKAPDRPRRKYSWWT